MRTLKRIIGVLLILALLCGVVYGLIRFLRTDFNGFGLQYNEADIVKDTNNLTINDGDVFNVKYYYTDTDDIEVYIAAKELQTDYVFQIDGQDVSWNDKFARADFTNAFDIRVDNEKNTFAIHGTIKEAIINLTSRENVEIAYPLPEEDMFTVYVKTAESTITLGVRYYAKVLAIELTPPAIVFRR